MADRYLSTQPYKGTRDFYPEDMALRQWFFGRMREVVESFGYQEYNGPILEPFDLYAAKSGQELVNEQIYHFEDQGKRHLAIRPEMTPTVARMVAARLKELSFPLRWYCIANLMRYERPQKGRLREHWQLNVDIFGEKGVAADLEIMTIIADLMAAFGAGPEMFRIKISNRRFFNEVLEKVLEVGPREVQTISKAVDKRAKISREDYDRWLGESGLSAGQIAQLDDVFQSSLEDLTRRLGAESQGARELGDLFDLLRAAGLGELCEFDFSIVRGFDYYTGTVFEVNDASPENRRALFGGGRYDNLIGLFKESDVSGIGFGFGDVTFQNFLEIHGLMPEGIGTGRKVLIANFADVPYAEYIRLSADLRAAGIANSISLDPSGKLKKQFQYAERGGYPLVLICGAQELERAEVVLKPMGPGEQITCSRAEMTARIGSILGNA